MWLALGLVLLLAEGFIWGGLGTVSTLVPNQVCRFSAIYGSRQLDQFSDSGVADKFVTDVLNGEKSFFETPYLSFDGETGWTYAGAVIDPQTGLRRTQDSAVLPWSSPGDEAMHLGIAILSLVETGSPPMLSPDTVLRLLTRKASAYNAFLDRNPQFGGFLPWVCSRGLAPSRRRRRRPRAEDSCATILDDAMDPSPVPNPDGLPGYPANGVSGSLLAGPNGMFAWAVFGLTGVLKAKVNCEVRTVNYQQSSSQRLPYHPRSRPSIHFSEPRSSRAL